MNLEEIEQIIQKEPSYRKKQIKKCLFQDLISDWSQATVLPLNIRGKLNEESPISIKAEKFIAKNNKSIKAVITLQDEEKIESVLMSYNDNRNTVCISSQVGCSLGCAFCATGREGFTRNLSFSEIIEQVLFFARLLKEEKNKITNIVFMGMGEPFLNYDNVMEAIRIINDKESFNIGARHISVSTAGIIAGINRLADEKMQINLAISFHAPNDELRSELMPIARKYSIEQLMEAVENYIEKKNRQVMFEYLLIDHVNDSEYCAKELAKLMKHQLYVVNLIRYNPTGGKFKPATVASIRKFKNILLREGIKVTERHEFGQDIKAACGQLAGRSK